jgi:hypothetical protein
MKTHELKTFPDFFNAILSGDKKFELRYDDRGFRAGDTLILREYDKKGGYSGRKIEAYITYILSGLPWLQNNYVAMSIEIEQ